MWPGAREVCPEVVRVLFDLAADLRGDELDCDGVIGAGHDLRDRQLAGRERGS